ncbi:hypothetical protein DRZ77_01085 [Candidatus Woesearchaeota archaeon]|nr:MAG: hypothetical protein DRZ77_01085 [Candidatus Woesearchaeota archaeon]
MVDKIKKALLIGAALAAFGLIDKAKAVANDDLDNVFGNGRVAIREDSKRKTRGYFSLNSIFWPDGSCGKGRLRVNNGPFGLYISGEEARRGDVGYDKVFGQAELVLGNDRLKLKPFIVGESTSYFGDSLLKNKLLDGVGSKIDVDIPGLSIDGVLFKEWGSYKIKGAEGRDNIERLFYGLRGSLGKRWRLIFHVKRDEKEYQHLGDIVRTDFGGGVQYRGRRVLIELLGGNEEIKYNPGNEFSSNYVKARGLVNLGKNCYLEVKGRYNFNGTDRLSKSPIPKYEVGVGIVIPFGHNPYLPRSKLGRR